MSGGGGEARRPIPVGVLGGGSWGTMLAHLAAQAGSEVALWMRDPEGVEELNEQGTNSRYLGDARLEEGIRATSDLEEAVRGRPLVMVALPSSAFREVIGEAGAFISGEQVVLSATKGFEPASLARMSEVMKAESAEVR